MTIRQVLFQAKGQKSYCLVQFTNRFGSYFMYILLEIIYTKYYKVSNEFCDFGPIVQPRQYWKFAICKRILLLRVFFFQIYIVQNECKIEFSVHRIVYATMLINKKKLENCQFWLKSILIEVKIVQNIGNQLCMPDFIVSVYSNWDE